MSFTLTQLRAEVQRFAPWIFPVISTVSAASNVAYLIDTTMWTDTGTDGDYLKAKTGVGAWIFRPGATTTERERRIGGTTGPIALDTGRLYHGGPAWSGAPSQGDAYEVHTMQPTLTFNMLVDVLDQLVVADLEEITLTDGEVIVTPPTWLLRDADLLKLMHAEYLTDGNADTRYFHKPFQKGRDYQFRVNQASTPVRTIEFRREPRYTLELWCEGLRPASGVYTLANTAAGEALPVVDLDRRMVALLWARSICLASLGSNPNDTQAKSTLEYIDGPKGKLGPLAQMLAAYERDLVTVQQEPVVLPTYRTLF
jgi:hypothetical protein